MRWRSRAETTRRRWSRFSGILGLMSGTTESGKDSALDAHATALLGGYRSALRDSSQLSWLPRTFVRHVVASSSREAVNRLVTTRELSVSERLKLFADEAARADPLRRVPAGVSVIARAVPFIALMAGGAVAGGALLWGLGALIRPHPGLFGLLVGAVWFGIVVVAVATSVFTYVEGKFDCGRTVLERSVDGPERKVFAALEEEGRQPGRMLERAVPAACAVLWLVLLGLVLAGFVVEHL
jgi:hypothetical protein